MKESVPKEDVWLNGWITFLQARALCAVFELPFSYSLRVDSARDGGVRSAGPGKYSFDHARIERMFFDGAPQPVKRALKPGSPRLGLGLEFK